MERTWDIEGADGGPHVRPGAHVPVPPQEPSLTQWPDEGTSQNHHVYAPPSSSTCSQRTSRKRARAEDPDIETVERSEQEAPLIDARAYQLEMFEESMKQNIVVTMDTGSGKTQVAVLRMQAELEKASGTPDQLVWFLAPTVTLCYQQHKVFSEQIPAVQTKLLTGASNVDTWDVNVWTGYLQDVRIVVSTYQVLLDAVTHAYVPIERLSLLVFDEAHNCVGNHPGTKIMDRYRLNKSRGRPVPAILGLTASPVIRSSLDLEKIEINLDAVCRSPRHHKAELTATVNQPQMSCVLYQAIAANDPKLITPSMISLWALAHNLPIDDDPYIRHLRGQDTERSRAALEHALRKQKTYVIDAVRGLCQRSFQVRCELGSWAADFLIRTSVSRYISFVESRDDEYGTVTEAEKRYLATLFGSLRLPETSPYQGIESSEQSSAKVRALVEALAASAHEPVTGIVFVRQRATASILVDMLSNDGLIRGRFRVGKMVGVSQHGSRKQGVWDLMADETVDGDDGDLQKFRAGKLDLLVATSVLEEGIDVPACNLVVCFDRPLNLKSFIQRRGRARMRDSRLILLLDQESTAEHEEWDKLEQEMKDRYESDVRKICEQARLGDEEKIDIAPLQSTLGNMLDFDQAKPHLEHVCTKLSSRQYVNARPFYILQEWEVSAEGKEGSQFRATVVLPVSLPPELRRIKGSRVWYSARNACKDAAFEAFKKLFEAGLVNDHFQPSHEELMDPLETRDAEAEVRESLNPWLRVAREWGKATHINRRGICLMNQHGKVIFKAQASLPVSFPSIPSFTVYWDLKNEWTVQLGEVACMPLNMLESDQSIALVDLAWGHRMELKETQHVVHLRTADELPFRQLIGSQPIERGGAAFEQTCLVRDKTRRPYFLVSSLPARPWANQIQELSSLVAEEAVDQPWLSLRKWPRRRDFLNPVFDDGVAPSTKPHQSVWPLALCGADAVSVEKVHFSAFIPSILHMVEIYLVAEQLKGTILKDLKLSNLELVVTALSSPQARERSNYERFEFLGDSILKLLTTVTLTANHPYFPEGYLSEKKHRIVSNARLCRAAVQTGLDQFIMLKSFTGAKWKPLYVDDVLAEAKEGEAKRCMSTKILADVVEALTGASFLDGGLGKALTCVSIFIPEVPWQEPGIARQTLFDRMEARGQLPAAFAGLEDLLGYSFRNKNLLIEAVTHPTFTHTSTSADMCMERLEFLGDAILDDVIVNTLWFSERELGHRDMHLLRAATVNADLLGYHMLDWTIPEVVTDVRMKGQGHVVVSQQVRKPVWKFMRHSSQELGAATRAAQDKFEQSRDAIREALANGGSFPWSLLAHLGIPKTLSDLFESLLGAVWVDSGCMTTCKEMVDRSGVLPCLRRLVRDRVDVMHPKNQLGEIVVDKTVRYEPYRRMVGGEQEWFCKVFVDDHFIVEVRHGISRDEIRTRAADAAYGLFKSIKAEQRS